MANTQNYINHLLQNTGITPACSEEERLAAEDIAQIFRNHGFDPEVQEFNAPAPSRLAFAVTGILAFAGALLMGIGGGIGLVGTLLAIVGAVLYVLERTGHPVVSRLGKTGVSQNVIAYHKASGPLASPRNRPVVVVAHYDSPRAELLAREPYASYRALIAKLLPVATVAPAAVAILRILPLPGALKVLLWIVAILASLVALANAANIISNRFVLPYTSGAVCNKSSVAAMLGVMDNVAPFQGENEFPDDVPFDTYFGEQKRRAEEMARAAAEYAAAQQQNDYGNTIEYEEPTYAEDEFGQPIAPDAQTEPEQGEAFDEQIEGFEGASADETLIGAIVLEDQNQAVQAEEFNDEVPTAEPAEEPVAAEPEPRLYRNAAGNIRFGSDAIRALGMLPESCTLDYEEGEEPTFEPEPAPVAQEPAPAANTAVAPAEPVAATVASAEPDDKPALDSAAGLDILAPAAPAQVEDETADEDYDEYPQRVSYESDTDFSAELPSTTPHADIASAFSSIGASASSFFKGAFAKGKKFVDDFEEKRAAAREAAEREAIAQQQAAEAERERAAQEFEQSEAEQPEPVDVAGATTSFEAPQPTSADVSAAAASSEAQQPVDGTMSFGATMTFEKQGTAIAESLPISDDAQDAADDSVVDEADSVEASAPEQVGAPAMEQKPPAVDEAPKMDESRPYSTQIFTMPAPSDPGATVANVAPTQDETVDSLMAQISSQVPPCQQMNIPDPASAPAPSSSPLASVPDPSLPSIQQANAASRTSLFDLPDPSAQTNDPFATAQGPEPTSAPVATPIPISPGAQPLETISAPASTGAKPQKRGLGGLFGRKKKNEQDSMSDWLGVEDDYDAKKSGRGIGSWDNFEDDDDGWKGGATSSDGASSEDMLLAVASMGDDELLGHDIWFVATGASDCDGAGMKAFLASHRDKLRGVFFINLESVGAGRLSVVTVEGEQQLLKGDRRIMNLVSKVCKSFHVDCGALEMPYAKTDAYAALEASRRALTIAGVDGTRLACARTEDDLPHNVNPTNIAAVSEVVTEVIRRS
ncbi:M28 family peptidase [Collinsella aerofaciens]|uniref:M28 family peptidase n=1 Tax=Collinsella aerofaciens TaxID=74426 RepID=UPI001C38F103|nr:M28 family peptidase [Collinsella aerofaciens]MBV4180801.1 M28 family peptidase [Collinsella aerofaciens]MBV4192834.1 M28 family peptidase [Collinsella aerofaciens]